MATPIRFPQGPIADSQGYVTLEWTEWLQNPQFLTISFAFAIGVSGGGTGLSSGTSGGILAFTGANTIASSGALGLNQIVLGGGAGGVPATSVGLGTATTVLHGNAGGAPSFGAVVLTTDVSGTLPVANGGTGIVAFGTGVATALGTNVNGSGAISLTTSPVFVTPTLGAANATSLGLAGFLRPATPAGATQTAASVYAGSGAPNNADGANGDFYFRSDGTVAGNNVAYHREAGAWVAFTTT